MKNGWVYGVIAVLIVFAIRLCFYCFDRSYTAGYDAGYEVGFEISSESLGSYDDGYSEGYQDGSSDGYYNGATYTCLFFGDVDKAFKSALNGCSWYTFVDAYDKYISNIYEDDDTRSALHWALISASLDDLSIDEADLLKKVFGEDLFIENDISLLTSSN